MSIKINSELSFDEIIKLYTEGYTYVIGKGKVKLNSGTNSFNVKYIKEINNLIYYFSELLILEKVAIKLVSPGNNASSGEMHNIWNLIKVAYDTIKVYQLYKDRIKIYKIDREKIVNAFDKYIDIQKERIERNEKIVISFMNDYGLGEVIQIIENENNMSLYEHIKKFNSTIDLDSENTLEMFNSGYVSDRYIEYAEDLMKNKGISISYSISKSLQKHRDNIQLKKEQKREKTKQDKEDKINRDIDNKLLNDNAKLQNDANASYYDKLKKLSSRDEASNLFKIVNKFGGKVCYISLVNTGKVRYLTREMGSTFSIFNAAFFADERYAKEFLDKAIKEKRVKLEGYHFYIGKILVNTSKIDNTDSLKVGELGELMYSDYASDKPSKAEIWFIRNALLKTNGYNSNSSVADVILLSVNTDKGLKKYVKITDNDFEFTEYEHEASIYLPEENIDNIVSKLKQKRYKVEKIRIKFNSLWYSNKIKEIAGIANTIQQISSGKRLDSNDISLNQASLFRDRVSEFKEQGYNKLYYIIFRSGTTKYYKKLSRDKRTTSIVQMELITNLDEALRVCRQEYKKDTIYVMKILSLNI